MSVIDPTILVKTDDGPCRPALGRERSQAVQWTAKWQFVRNAATLTFGTATAQAVNVAVAPVLTRLYSPGDLGLLGLFTSFLMVAAVAISMSYELGIVSAPNTEKAARLTWASVLLSVPVCAVCGTVLYIMMHFHWLGYGALPAYSTPLMVATLLFIGVFSNLRYWEIRQQHFDIIARTTVVQQATRSISQAVLGFAGIGPAGLLFGEMMGRAAGVGSLFRDAWPALKNVVANAHRNHLVSALAENRNLAGYSLPSSLIDTLAANMPLPLLVQLYGSALGGQFSLMQRVLSVPLALIATSVADTFHSRIAGCVREKPGDVLGLFCAPVPGCSCLVWARHSYFSLAGTGSSHWFSGNPGLPPAHWQGLQLLSSWHR